MNQKKKFYEKPVLNEHGDLKTITNGTGGDFTDADDSPSSNFIS